MRNSIRINLSVSERDYNLLLEIKDRLYKRLRLTTVVKNMALDRAEELIKKYEKNGRFQQLDLLRDGEDKG